MLADLHAASHHAADASRLYQQLERTSRNGGCLRCCRLSCVEINRKEDARREFRKAYDLGSTDPQLCMQLATWIVSEATAGVSWKNFKEP